MPPKISVEEMELILEVFHYFESELKRGAPFHSSKHRLKISESLLKKLLRENSNDEEKEIFKERKDKILDSFDKDLIKTVVFNLFSKNERITLKKLKSY
jgi:ppGpp synthetase/RelA/SpoT-type nucleotidyltranferase